MDLTECLSTDRILPQLQSEQRRDVVEELVELLAEEGSVSDFEGALERVLERESLETTCIGGGIAVPHARIAGLSEMVLALGRSSDGIDFQSLDGSPARVIFLMLYPPAEAARHLAFLSMISVLAVRHDLVERVLKAEGAEDILGVIEATQAEEAALHSAQTDAAQGELKEALLDDKGALVNPILGLLARLQRFEQFRHAEDEEPTDALLEKIENIRSLIPSRYLKHFDRLMKRGGLAVVATENKSCQGCYVEFSSAFQQELLEEGRIFTCPTCRRFLFRV